jgi:hypothetical protein
MRKKKTETKTRVHAKEIFGLITGKAGGLTKLVENSINGNVDVLADVADLIARESNPDIRNNQLSKLRATMERVCKKLGVKKLTVRDDGGGWRVCQPAYRDGTERKIAAVFKAVKRVDLLIEDLDESDRKNVIRDLRRHFSC